jgi:hypothetical protein
MFPKLDNNGVSIYKLGLNNLRAQNFGVADMHSSSTTSHKLGLAQLYMELQVTAEDE